MKRATITSTIALIFLTASSLNAQTLFKYGNHEVSKQEFLRAFNKNSNGEKPDEAAYREYLDLYTRFKLKVQAAYDQKMDTLPGQIAELQSFRGQVVHNYMEDDSTVERLLAEAFKRSQKDIHIAHIFIPYNGSSDTARAYKLAMDAWNELKKGTNFGNVARLYSSDSAAWKTQGDIGYISVFTLPYDLETLAYSTPPGSFSKPYASQSGYHIFKNLDERKAVGKISIAQILLAFAPDADENSKKLIKAKADSIYSLLQKGARFDELVAQFSNDNHSFRMGGELPPFGIGVYEPAFEKAAFALNKNGAISKPVLTKLGYHIIKRLNAFPVNTNSDSADAMTELKMQVKNDLRINETSKSIVSKAYRLTQLKKEEYGETEVLNYYRDNLEKYNPEFAIQMGEFKDGNLLFEIMQSTIWDQAGNDSLALKAYYEAHAANYNWEPSADVIVFTCNDFATAESIRASFSINTSGWRELIKANEDKMQADSGRYELTQLPISDTALLKQGIITQPLTNASDNTTSFIYVIKKYNDRSPRTFNEAKGFVLNDYQTSLEETWVENLKKKYPVVVNENVFKSLLN